jgi:hypothetical protein
MGGSPSMPAPQPLPPAPQPIDYDKMANASIRVAKAQSAEQEASIKRLYPEYTKLQFQTADQLAGKLDNEYLARTRGVVGEELTAASTPNAIEARLQQDAESELALGRSLSPEQQRQATQSARAAFAARGMATGNAAAGAEILNRDAFATARQDQRRGFAAGVNQMDLARRQRRVGLAGAYGDLDPFRQSIGPAFQLGSKHLVQHDQSGERASFAARWQQAGRVESFNTNMAMNRYNSVMNNNAALQSAGMQAGAAGQAGMMGMVGSGVGAAVGIAGIGIAI